MSLVRLQKFMAECGVGSRRKCEEIILSGRVKVNGQTAELGTKIDLQKDEVKVNDKLIRQESPVYFAFNKPKGVTSTCYDRYADKTVLDAVKSAERIYPVGRLDKESRGLMILTNDGELAYELTHPKFGHEKEYLVTTKDIVKEEQIKKISRGMKLEEGLAKAKEIVKVSDRQLKIILTQGMKRQIRRMAEAVGNKVTDLRRTRIGKLKLGKLAEGKFKKILKSDVV